MSDSAEKAGMRMEEHQDDNLEEDKTNPAPLVIGMEFKCLPQLPAMVQHALDNYFDFVLLPLVHPRFRRDLVSQLDHLFLGLYVYYICLFCVVLLELRCGAGCSFHSV